MRPHCVGNFIALAVHSNIFLNCRASAVTRLSHQRVNVWHRPPANQMARYWKSLPNWMIRIKAAVRRLRHGGSSFRSVGIFISIGVAAIAVYALRVIRPTKFSLIALAAMLVATSYVSRGRFPAAAGQSLARWRAASDSARLPFLVLGPLRAISGPNVGRCGFRRALWCSGRS
jgi:hypothetical protein